MSDPLTPTPKVGKRPRSNTPCKYFVLLIKNTRFFSDNIQIFALWILVGPMTLFEFDWLREGGETTH